MFIALLGIATPSATRAEPPARAVLDITSYGFDDEIVAGDTLNPNGEVLQVRRAWDRESLIRVRTSFVDSLSKSVEAL